MVGTNHKHANIEIRERLWCQASPLPDRLRSIVKQNRNIKEAAILCTCNRTEIYSVSSHDGSNRDELSQLMSDWGEIRPTVLRRHIYSLNGKEAVRHLFAVSSGLDSLVIGEREIQGQVRDAVDGAIRAGTAGPFLSQLFEHASRVANSVRKESGLGRDRASVSSAAVSLLKDVSVGHNGCCVLLIGAGKMITLAAEQLAQDGKFSIWIVNRTPERAEELTKRFGGKPLSLDAIPFALEAADAVISCTSSPYYVILARDLETVMPKRKGRSIVLIDIAVPRNIDPAAAKIPNVQLYNVDDLAPFLQGSLASCRSRIAEAECHVNSEAEKFTAKIRNHDVIDTVRELRRMAEEIRVRELSRALRGLSSISPRDKQVVALLTRSIINKLLHEPTVRLRHQALSTSRENYAPAVRELFAMQRDN